MLNKKSRQIQEMSEEKGTLNGEIHDLKDMLDVKERKVNVLQKKVGSAAEVVPMQTRPFRSIPKIYRLPLFHLSSPSQFQKSVKSFCSYSSCCLRAIVRC